MASQSASRNQASTSAADGLELAPRDHNNPPNLVELFLEQLVSVYGKQIADFEPIASRANAAKQKIETDDDLKVWADIYLDASVVFKALDRHRINELKPFAEVLNKTFFGGTLERADRIMAFGKKISDEYNRAKLAKERGERDAEAKRLRDEAEQKRKDAEVAAEFGDVDQTIEHAQGAAAIESQIAQAAADAPKAADVARVRSDSGALATVATKWAFAIEDYTQVDLNAIRIAFSPADIDKAVRKIVSTQKGATKIAGVRVFEDVGTTFRR